MNPTLRTLALLFAPACVGPPGDTGAGEHSAEAVALAAALEGQWTMSSEITTDCPDGSALPAFEGETRWVRDGAQVTIEASNGSWSAAPMVAVAEDFLRHSKEYSKSGCTIWVDIGMTVCGLADHKGRGVYEAVITSEGGACSAYASSLGLPLDCSASGRWWIER